MIQEHKMDEKQILSLSKACLAKGWRGVWTPAATTGDHHLSRSGGLAILVPSWLLLTQGKEAMTHRYLRASIPWTRRKQIHLFNLYAFDIGQDDRETQNGALYDYTQSILAQLGPVPWVLAADFNQQPGEPLPT